MTDHSTFTASRWIPHASAGSRRSFAFVALIAALSLPAFAMQAARDESPAAQTPASAPAAHPRLKLSSEMWDFGAVWQGADVHTSITISNEGDAPLKIESIKATCGCTTVKQPKDVLAPGESDVVEIRYDAKKRVGVATQNVTIKSNDSERPSVTIKVAGNVRLVYTMSPTTATTFGRLLKNADETRTVELRNAYPGKMAMKLEKVSGSGFSVKLEELDPGATYRLTMSTTPPLSLGSIETQVVLSTGLDVLPEVTIPIRAYVQERVSLIPNQIYVPKSLGRVLDRPIRLAYYKKGRPVKVTAVISHNERIKAELEADPSPSPDADPFAYHTIHVAILQDVVLPNGGETIEVLTDDPEYPKLELRVIGRVMPSDKPKFKIIELTPTSQPAAPGEESGDESNSGEEG